MKTLWKYILKRKWLLLFVSTGIILALLYLLIFLVDYNHPLLGFGELKVIDDKIEFYRPAKTFWDWMQLLIIPIALVLGGYFLNRSEKRLEINLAKERAETDRSIAEERNQETALSEYFDRMSELLLDYNLKDSAVDSIHREVAKTRTLTIFRRLNGDRKGIVLRFLAESDLIKRKGENNPVINITQANLASANLELTDLEGANLELTDLEGANLEGANLGGANLGGVKLEGANLAGANLQGVNLAWAQLEGVNLEGENLADANLADANLAGAKLAGAKLAGANLERANLKGVNLELTDLVGAKLAGANLKAANLKAANLKAANLEFTDLGGANLAWAKLEGVNLAEAKLEGANLVDANLADANLAWANFVKANLELTGLGGANLDGTIFVFAKYLTQSQLNQAFYIKAPPELPEGLKPPPKRKTN